MRSDLDHGNLELFEVRPRLLAPRVAEEQSATRANLQRRPLDQGDGEGVAGGVYDI